MNCVNINGTIINLWETEVGEYLVTPANLEVFELFKWLDCTDEQDIGDLLVLNEGCATIRLNFAAVKLFV
ncbi:hypothetical protein G9P44_001212 [Scheffersomyces stipitis]|nr:hypothetical protein G9P44_001212 [Scheffersomyces stipitis]